MRRRIVLAPGARLHLPHGGLYEITGSPIGSGGGSVVYPAVRLIEQADGTLDSDGMLYALKECYPLSQQHSYIRAESGEIVPENPTADEWQYLRRVQQMQLDEQKTTQKIYQTSSRLIPIREAADSVELMLPGKEPVLVHNAVTVMESLHFKGQSLSVLLRQEGSLSPLPAFRVIQQVLFALREIHQSGFLHLDVQDGNIYLKGSLEDESDTATIIDFGSARPLLDGKTEPICDRVIFTTPGFSAPEILLHNDGNLRLGPEADLYSVGCLALYLLTGTRQNAQQLLGNSSGQYLPRHRLRRMKLQPHLADRMQSILAKALASEPAERYRSADEMLTDVADLIRALAPYRGDLSAVTYDAFICYRHGPIDSPAAKELQKQLEHFHAPRELSKQRHPFRRVFVDEGELSSCADFGAQIREALKNAGWLIVICSPETPASPWVQLEIDTFLEHHNRNRILAVLTAGEPQESFPPQLLGNIDGSEQALAADARGSTLSAVRKKLRGDTLLRLTAPMLGVTFDSLKQRRRLYVFQRTAAIAALVMLAAVGFTGYALVQNQRINQAQETALLNQSQYLATLAQEQLEDNNPLEAIQTVLTSFPSDGTLNLNATAQYVLTEALGKYTLPDDGSGDTLSVTGAFQHGDSITSYELAVDEDADYLFTCDGYHIYVWDVENCALLHTISGDTEGKISDFRPELVLSERKQLIFRDSDSIYCYNYEDAQMLWRFNISKADSSVGIAMNEPQNTLVVAYGEPTVNIVSLSLETGEAQSSFTVSLPADSQLVFDTIALNANGSLLAFDVHADSEQPSEALDYNEWYYEATDDLIVIADLAEQSGNVISPNMGLIYRACFTAENDLLLVSTSGFSYYIGSAFNSGSGYVADPGAVETDQMKTVSIQRYSLDTGSTVWQREFSCGAGSTGPILKLVTEEEQSAVLLCYSNICALLSLADGALQQDWELSGAVQKLLKVSDDGFKVITDDGRFQSITFGEKRWSSLPWYANSLTDYITCSEAILTVAASDPTVVTKYEFLSDENWNSILGTETYDFTTNYDSVYTDKTITVFLNSSEDQVLLYDTASETVKSVTLWDSTDRLESYELLGIYDRKGRKTLMLSAYDWYGDSDQYDSHCVLCIDLETLEQSICYIPSPTQTLTNWMVSIDEETGERSDWLEEQECTLSISNIVYVEDTAYFLCSATSYQEANSSGASVSLFLYRWTIGDEAPQELATYQAEEDNDNSEELIVSPNGKDILVIYEDSVLRFDSASGTLRQILDDVSLNVTHFENYIGWVNDSHSFYILYPDRITFYNRKGQELSSVVYDSSEEVYDLSFTPDGELLLLTEYGKLLKYDRSSGELLCSLELDTERFAPSSDFVQRFSYYGDGMLAISCTDTVLIDTNTDTWGVCGYIESGFYYDSVRDCFYIDNYSEGLGSFPRYTPEELVEAGREALGENS